MPWPVEPGSAFHRHCVAAQERKPSGRLYTDVCGHDELNGEEVHY